MLTVFGTLNSGVGTRRATAFTVDTVTSTADSGPGSLRDTIASAASGDIVVFNLALPTTIGLTTGSIGIATSITIAGPGANLLTISGSNKSNVFGVADNITVTITGITIANGTDVFGGGGGGIIGSGTLALTNCIFTNNKTVDAGGAIRMLNGSLSVTNCTFNNNTTTNGGGGAIANVQQGTLSVTNCTFSKNTALFGGAIDNETDAAVSVTNCTLSANSTSGIAVSLGTLNIQNTIIADSTGGADCTSTSPLGVNTHNLIKDGSCSPMLSGNPMLGPLQNNGGTTPTMALLPGSPAIDAGDDSVVGAPLGLTTDQRGPGFPRKVGAHVDIGAFEFSVPAGPSFDTCLKDNTTGNLLQWNSSTGQYQFTRCSDKFTLTGTGTVGLVNGIRTLNDFKTDRRISAGFNTGQLTGNATIYLKVAQGVWQTFRIVDTNPSAVCKC
jgi:predicted outer membrane repeat protein